MGNYKGDLEGVPDKVVNLMIKRQVEQGNPADVSVFEYSKYAGSVLKGFDWGNTEEGYAVWESVIMFEEFDLIPDPQSDIVSSDTHALDTWTKRK